MQLEKPVRVVGQEHASAQWDWRHRNKTTLVLGAILADQGSKPPSRRSRASGCVIAAMRDQGERERRGERIYHESGQLAQISLSNGRGERWFCTEAEAGRMA
ncbi:hypothetical protein Q2941_35860 [Bradyrhizobium sp. UFLA05-153]